MKKSVEDYPYLRVGLYFSKPADLRKIDRAAKASNRSRSNWIIYAALRVAEEELGKAKATTPPSGASGAL